MIISKVDTNRLIRKDAIKLNLFKTSKIPCCPDLRCLQKTHNNSDVPHCQ